MSAVTIRWRQGPFEGQSDAFFYDNGLVAEVILDGKIIAAAYCDGETRLINPDGETIRRYHDWADELSDDKKLSDAFASGGWECIHNPWFDFYSPDGEHLDAVCHTVEEIIELSKAMPEHLGLTKAMPEHLDFTCG